MRGLKISFALLATVMALTSAAHAQPVVIRNSYVVPVSDWPPMILAKKDLAKHWGKSYVMEATRYQGTSAMITALANNELDVAGLAYSTLGLAISNAGISDLRVVSDGFRDGVPGYFSNQFFVRKDSNIKKIEDLKGKVLATNLIGTGADIAMKAGLKKHGLLDKRDYTVIEVPFPTMPAILNDKKADLVTAVMPFALNPMLNEIGVPLYDQTEGLGTSQFTFAAMRQVLHRQESRGADRLHGGFDYHRALVSRSEKPRRGGEDRLRAPEDSTGAVQLAVHQEGLLPEPGSAAGPRSLAAQRRHRLRLRRLQGANSTSRNTPTSASSKRQ